MCSSTDNNGVMPGHQRQTVCRQLWSYVLEAKHFCVGNVVNFRFVAWSSCPQLQWKSSTALELRRCNTDAKDSKIHSTQHNVSLEMGKDIQCAFLFKTHKALYLKYIKDLDFLTSFCAVQLPEYRLPVVLLDYCIWTWDLIHKQPVSAQYLYPTNLAN